jgi:sodium/proline symporter
MIGIIGRALFPIELTTAGAAETIFIVTAKALFNPIFAGLAMAGILAATISSADSYLLIGASAFSKNIYQGLFKKDATDKQVMTITRIILLTITAIGIFIALDENSVIFTIVSFAWAGLGATFGPLMLFSLFWKRTTREGAIAGMLAGAIMVFVWKLLLRPMGGLFGVYELLPAFIFSCLVIYFVSKATPEPSKEIQEEFELVKSDKSIEI